jgi:hypothetical protein
MWLRAASYGQLIVTIADGNEEEKTKQYIAQVV